MKKEIVRDIVQWDVNTWKKAISYWESKLDWGKIENGLELGGREGGLSLWMALKGKKVICSDLSDVQKNAEPLHKKYGVESHIEYRDIDAANIPYENHFDVILFKSILGGIGRNDNYVLQKKVLREIHKALKPGGKLLFAENLIASTLHQKLRKKYINWGDSWRYLSIPELNEMLKDFHHYEIKTTGVLGTFGRTEKQRSILAGFDQLFFNAVSPKSWKYVAYGIAEK